MEKIGMILTPALTILLVSLIIPWAISVRQRAEKKAVVEKHICYSRASVNAMWILSGVSILLTVAALVCTILSIVNPEMMGVSADDTAGITITCVLSIALDIFTITVSIMYMRTITYNSESFTDTKFYNKKREYLYRDITNIECTVKVSPTYTAYGVYKGMKGKLKIYFGEQCVKIPAKMLGITEFISFLQTQCPNLFIN